MLALLLVIGVQAQVIGFDFGSTFFKITLVKPGSPFSIVENTTSKRKTETMVTFGPENRLWGYDSFVAEGRYPKTTFSSVASFLGADYDEEFLKTLALDRFVLNEFVEDDRGCIAYQTFSLDSKEETTVYYAEELVAMILNYGRKLAEAQAEG